MKIGIICASMDEVEPILKELELTKTVEKAMLKIHEGKLWGMDAVVLFCGVCKVNAALATQILIDDHHVDRILNVGVAGGMDPKVKVFDTVISTEVTYHDIQPGILTGYHPWMKSEWFSADEELISLAKKATADIETKGRIYFGRMVTGELFIEDNGRDTILEKFMPLSVDMESGSIAHVCYVNKVPFLIIRSITDTAEHSGSSNFENNLKEAVKISCDITRELFRELEKV